VLVALAAPAAGAASPCAPVAALGATDARLAAIDPALRLRYIDGELARSARKASLWTWGWGIALGVGTVANLVPLAFVPEDERIDWYTGAVTTAIGVVPLVIAPLDVIADSRELRERLAAPAAAHFDVCSLVADAELRLVRDAKNQADGQRWWLHVGNVVLNAGVGLFLGLGFHHWGAGAWNAGFGAVVGEAIILTQPTGAIDSLDRYRAGSLDGGAAPATAVGVSRSF
jgi:hypothetical protein